MQSRRLQEQRLRGRQMLGAPMSVETSQDKAAFDAMLAALERSLNWLSSYPGGLSLGCYDQARAAIDLAKQSQQDAKE
jgi:hypothetical protein